MSVYVPEKDCKLVQITDLERGDVKSVTGRFVTRLALPSGMDCRIDAVYEAKSIRAGSSLRSWFDHACSYIFARKPRGPALELYHSARCFKRDLDESKELNIFRQGFRFYGGGFGNKGPGSYFANHSRYAWKWGSTYWGGRVIVSHIYDLNNKGIVRFRSEVAAPSPLADASEYVVRDPAIVHPRFVIDFCITGDAAPINPVFKPESRYVEHGKFGCHRCDPMLSRCDCEQLPIVLTTDLV
jgi:hypothetical protein